MKPRWLIAAVAVGFLSIITTTVIVAQSEPPPPYAGLKNPFAWTDAQAQAAGKQVYQQSCAGCHGVRGNGVAAFDFSKPSYSKSLEAKPDFYFWVLSEGRLNQGMPPYKSSFSEEKRWQTLTYIWSLSQAPPPPVTPPPTKPPVEGISLALTMPAQAKTGQGLTLTVILKDKQGKPISDATIKFLLSVDFFASGLMEIGEGVTNEQGIATFQYIPRGAGETNVTARYETFETDAKLSVAESGEIFYQTEAGINLPSLGPEIFVGPESAHELGEQGNAPTSALRLPGGILSWLLLFVGVLMLVWGTYLVVMYQVLRISTLKESTASNTRVPLVWLAIVAGLGILMILMVITGPFSNFHLLR